MASGTSNPNIGIPLGNEGGTGNPEGGNRQSEIGLGSDFHNTNSNASAVDPEIARAASSGDTAGNAPKQKRKYTKRADKENIQADLGAFQTAIISTHILLAKFVAPELELTEGEGKMMAEALARCEKHYPAISYAMRGKVADHISLAAAISAIYGTRIIAIQARVNKEKSERGPTIIDIQTGQPFRPAG